MKKEISGALRIILCRSTLEVIFMSTIHDTSMSEAAQEGGECPWHSTIPPGTTVPEDLALVRTNNAERGSCASAKSHRDRKDRKAASMKCLTVMMKAGYKNRKNVNWTGAYVTPALERCRKHGRTMQRL